MPYKPGEIVPKTGTYKCIACNKGEAYCKKGDKFPPCETDDCEHPLWVLKDKQ